MENASKALIIAGAILIAILLIGVGVMVMRGASAPVEQGKAISDSSAIQIANDPFLKYTGVGKRASEIKELANTVITSNSVNTTRTVSITYNSVTAANSFTATTDTTKITTLNNLVNANRRYQVAVTYTAGYIRGIIITETNT